MLISVTSETEKKLISNCPIRLIVLDVLDVALVLNVFIVLNVLIALIVLNGLLRKHGDTFSQTLYH